MAKQTFSVGQVLTAAQMTSLQQTAMLGGAASAKTTSYTLVAADAGTAISMSSTSATTITVNTGLFAAGDTVQITNLNTGVCTITAGTATVNTSASLALAQYESGTLTFTSASAAIFIKGAGAAAGGGGKVLQVVNATYSTTTTIASTTKTDTGLSASITPTANTSKILVLVSQHIWVNNDTERVQGGGVYLLRGSTEIWDGSDQLSWHNFGSGFMQYGALWTLHYYDSPATTSSTTYKTQGDSWTTNYNSNIKFQQNSVTSSITLLEIGA